MKQRRSPCGPAANLLGAEAVLNGGRLSPEGSIGDYLSDRMAKSKGITQKLLSNPDANTEKERSF